MLGFTSVLPHEHYKVCYMAATKNGKIHILYHSVHIKIRLCATNTTKQRHEFLTTSPSYLC